MPSLTEDLKRIRTEREDVKHKLESAEKRLRENQDAADKENEHSFEMGKLKRDLDRARQELDEAKLRYRKRCSVTCYETNIRLISNIQKPVYLFDILCQLKYA